MSGRRDVDQYDRVLKFKMIMWSAPGAVLGGIAGLLTGHVVLGTVAGAAAVFLLVNFTVGGAGRAAGTLHNPSGRSTPHKREYSGAESLVVRGRFAEAVTAFEAHVVEHPTDPVPYLRLARIHRDHLADYETAARWFKRACRESEMERGVEMLARRELVEMYMNRSGEPARAAPELARMADEWADTPEGAWAAAELAELKERMRRDAEGTGSESDGT